MYDYRFILVVCLNVLEQDYSLILSVASASSAALKSSPIFYLVNEIVYFQTVNSDTNFYWIGFLYRCPDYYGFSSDTSRCEKLIDLPTCNASFRLGFIQLPFPSLRTRNKIPSRLQIGNAYSNYYANHYFQWIMIQISFKNNTFGLFIGKI